MKVLGGWILMVMVLIGCGSNEMKNDGNDLPKEDLTRKFPVFKMTPAFGEILSAVQMNGSIVISDPQENIIYTNDTIWAKTGRLPASTFKIVNSIIGLETGILKDENTLFLWDGAPREMAVWEKDLVLSEAFSTSCVPCYRELARKIGIDQMQAYLEKLNFGAMSVSEDNLDLFWLVGASKVSAMEQIDFLERLYTKKLPIETHTYAVMKRIMELEKTTEYTLSGKTGLSVGDAGSNAWFVGYLEKKGNVYYFAVNINPGETYTFDDLRKARKESAMQAFQQLGIID